MVPTSLYQNGVQRVRGARLGTLQPAQAPGPRSSKVNRCASPNGLRSC